MSLRDRIEREFGTSDSQTHSLYRRFGVVANPFPAAGQSSDNPHLETEADEEIITAVLTFQRDQYASQVIVIEGTQGAGKTNLLNYYQEEFQDLFSGDANFYVIRYYPDPEPAFDSIIRKVIQALGSDHLCRIAQSIANRDDAEFQRIKNLVVGHEMRQLLVALRNAASGTAELQDTARLGEEWLLGLRLLKQHREALHIDFRLDTVESRIQALKDLVNVSASLGLLRGIFLLLDELEKQDYSATKTAVIRFLFAIRALIDALPRHLFLMMAMTRIARSRYFSMLPALAGRLQNVVLLQPLHSFEDANRLIDFYVERAKRVAGQHMPEGRMQIGSTEVIPVERRRRLYEDARSEAAERGSEGLTPRDLLHAAHVEFEAQIRRPG